MKSITPSSTLSSSFVSPVHQGSLQEEAGHWVCAASGVKFPIIDGIPWLLPDPKRVLADWRNRAQSLIAHYEHSIALLKENLKEEGLRDSTVERLKKSRTLEIRHVEFLRDILSPLLKPGANKMSTEQAGAFGYKIPANQGLLGYFPNIVRDWFSDSQFDGQSENEAAFAVLAKCIDSAAASEAALGRVAVLGAGACRLAYDLHQTGWPAETICIDINPVLFLTARRILGGSTVHVVEFPVAPKSIDSVGAVRACRAPRPTREGLHQVFADCYYLPFADASLDTVVTSWVIDILPHPFAALVREIARVLKPGGRWLNTGSLCFQLSRSADCHSPEEAREVIEELGFAVEAFRQDTIPYLRSELSCQARTETVTSFRAQRTETEADAKVGSGSPSTAHDGTHVLPPQPGWLLEPRAPVPLLPTFQSNFVYFESQAFVLSLIDGRRSIEDMSSILAQRTGLALDEAREAIVSFFTRQIESATFRTAP